MLLYGSGDRRTRRLKCCCAETTETSNKEEGEGGVNCWKHLCCDRDPCESCFCELHLPSKITRGEKQSGWLTGSGKSHVNHSSASGLKKGRCQVPRPQEATLAVTHWLKLINRSSWVQHWSFWVTFQVWPPFRLALVVCVCVCVRVKLTGTSYLQWT